MLTKDTFDKLQFNSFSDRFLLVFFFTSLALLSSILRGILIYEKNISFSAIELFASISDLSIGIIVSFTILAASRVNRWLAFCLAIIWVLSNFSYYEYVSVFDSAYFTSHLHHLIDPTFFSGSAIHTKHPILLILFLALTSVTIFMKHTLLTKRSIQYFTIIPLTLLVIISITTPTNSEILSWRQGNFILKNLPKLLDNNKNKKHSTDQISNSVNNIFKSSLDGYWDFSEIDRSKIKNILIIVLESVSGAHLPSIADHHHIESKIKMPLLDTISRLNTSYNTFITPQRQTNRGEYSLLCGDYPKLNSDVAKMTEISMSAYPKRCLPSVLSDAGFHTVYLQAAPLGFMLKDKFMKKIGFNEVIGDEYFKNSYARTSWGVDDKSFFEQSLQKIKTLNNSGEPWFLTLLTVGTHHPYPVPASFLPGSNLSAQERAIAWTDSAIHDFIEQLKDENIPSNTLILLTSDESSGLTHTPNNIDREISQNWGFLTILNNKKNPRTVSTPYSLSDISLSIIDFFNLQHESESFIGRSIFRAYDSSRPMYFGNTYSHKIYQYLPGNILNTCNDMGEQCRSYSLEKESLFSPKKTSKKTMKQHHINSLLEVLSKSVSAPTPTSNTTRLSLLSENTIKINEPKYQLVFGGQYLSVPENSTIKMDLEIEAKGEGGEVILSHQLQGKDISLFKIPQTSLYSGDKLQLTYTRSVKASVKRLTSTLIAKKSSPHPVSIKINKALIEIFPNDKSENKTNIITYKRTANPNNLEKATYDLSLFQKNTCFSKDKNKALVGTECKKGFLLYGPYIKAPRGATVDLEFDIESLSGNFTIGTDIASNSGKKIYTKSKHILLNKGVRKVVKQNYKTFESVKNLEARLFSIKTDNSNPKIKIHNAKLTVTFAKEYSDTLAKNKNGFSAQRVAHAAGGIDSMTYTNSYDALNLNYKKGFRYFELDFIFSEDNRLLCLHDWENDFKKSFGFNTDKKLTSSEFLSLVDTKSKFKKCTGEGLINWLSNHKDAFIVTDVKDDNILALATLRKIIPDAKNRIIPQIYNPDNYNLVKELGFKQIIWTLYRYPGSNIEILKWVKQFNGSFAITMPTKQANSILPAQLNELNIPVYVHTVNNIESAHKYISEFGATEIYTDFLQP